MNLKKIWKNFWAGKRLKKILEKFLLSKKNREKNSRKIFKLELIQK